MYHMIDTACYVGVLMINRDNAGNCPMHVVCLLSTAVQTRVSQIGVKGAVLLAPEGINVNIAGSRAQIAASISRFNAIPEIANLWLKESVSGFVPHKRLKRAAKAPCSPATGARKTESMAC